MCLSYYLVMQMSFIDMHLYMELNSGMQLCGKLEAISKV